VGEAPDTGERLWEVVVDLHRLVASAECKAVRVPGKGDVVLILVDVLGGEVALRDLFGAEGDDGGGSKLGGADGGRGYGADGHLREGLVGRQVPRVADRVDADEEFVGD